MRNRSNFRGFRLFWLLLPVVGAATNTATPLGPPSQVGQLPSPGAASQDQTKSGTRTVNAESLLANLKEALANGRSDRAREATVELLQQPSLKAGLLLEAGSSLAQQELYEEASLAFSRCVKDYPEIFEGYYDLALSELASGNAPRALETMEKAPRATREQEIARRYLRGKIEATMGRVNDAERDLTAAFTASPQEENYALDLGLLYLRQKNYAKAIQIFDQGSQSPPASAFIWLGLGLAQLLGGLPEASVETCSKILKRDESFSPARALMAFALYMGGKYPEAVRVSGAEIRSGQSFPYLYYMHAAAQLRLQSTDYEGMLRDLDLAAKNIPVCSLCYLTRSKIHESMGARDEATTDLQHSLRLDPSLAEAWYRLASLYSRAGRNADASKARAQFNRLKEEKSSHETDMIRDAFIGALGGEKGTASAR